MGLMRTKLHRTALIRACAFCRESNCHHVLSGKLRPVSSQRRAPVDAFEQVAELRCCDRPRFAIRSRLCTWPDEAGRALQPLGEQAGALPVG